MAIIGVVAAMTIPTLIAKHQKQVTVERLKSTYSVLSQVVNFAKLDYGDLNTWDFELSNVDFAKKYVLPYLKVAKTIDKIGDSACWNMTPWSVCSSESIVNNPIYILPNDATITVTRFGNNKFIYVDINGHKKPNSFFHDVFVFDINKQRNYLFPYGYNEDRDVLLGKKDFENYACSKQAEGYYSGYKCAAVIMLDGWKISSDYPW